MQCEFDLTFRVIRKFDTGDSFQQRTRPLKILRINWSHKKNGSFLVYIFYRGLNVHILSGDIIQPGIAKSQLLISEKRGNYWLNFDCPYFRPIGVLSNNFCTDSFVRITWGPFRSPTRKKNEFFPREFGKIANFVNFDAKSFKIPT